MPRVYSGYHLRLQQLRHVGVLREVDRQIAVVRPREDVCAKHDQHAGHLEETARRGRVQRGQSVHVGDVDVGAEVHQHLDAVEVVVQDALVQRRDAGVIVPVDVHSGVLQRVQDQPQFVVVAILDNRLEDRFRRKRYPSHSEAGRQLLGRHASRRLDGAGCRNDQSDGCSRLRQGRSCCVDQSGGVVPTTNDLNRRNLPTSYENDFLFPVFFTGGSHTPLTWYSRK